MRNAFRWLPFVNRGTREIPPFAVMAPATISPSSSLKLGAVETADDDACLRLAPVDEAHAQLQDAGLLFVNGPQTVPVRRRGNCVQSGVIQALVRQDESDGIDHRALVRPDVLLGATEDCFALGAGGSAYRFLGFEGCPATEYRDPANLQQRYRIGWVTPSYSAATRYFKTEELRRQYVYPYAGIGLILEENRASLSGGATRPQLSSSVDFAYRAYDAAVAPGGAPNFAKVKWGTPPLPASRSGDTQSPIAADEKGVMQIECKVDGVYQIGFTASIKAVEAGIDVRGMTLGFLVERQRFDYQASRESDLADDESGIFLSAWQEGIYVRPENWAQFEEIDSYFTTVSGTTIVAAQRGDRFHIINAATGVLEIRYLNCWASGL
ncbi:hypothetical protein LOC68_09905 [Blastopirellula sp. JC732]|uniref:Uncharacterized protein n=1 Tax=Blastopirellula sediminis TaxID=2894196 RepID=A0A9X1MLV0_9BACT|nr:hypothetical protein [Blastopirellula sediminis]MCC9608511.1 hypothetical protein [Blastopirellula sediminis]MCC9628712.1 hypothetical protein [Blastopirellula sediminis]